MNLLIDRVKILLAVIFEEDGLGYCLSQGKKHKWIPASGFGVTSVQKNTNLRPYTDGLR
jgi:hypothetical protein